MVWFCLQIKPIRRLFGQLQHRGSWEMTMHTHLLSLSLTHTHTHIHSLTHTHPVNTTLLLILQQLKQQREVYCETRPQQDNFRHAFRTPFCAFQETHVIHTFKEDFYGQTLSVVMIGYIRPEKGFDSLGRSRSSTNGTPCPHKELSVCALSINGAICNNKSQWLNGRLWNDLVVNMLTFTFN